MHIEKILFERTGGFAGIRIAADIEMDDLPKDQQDQISQLLDKLDFDGLPEKLGDQTSLTDGFVYSITVNSLEEEHSVVTNESSMPVDLQPLIEILESIAKRQMRKKS
jgi:hypothetical protein